MVMWAREWLQAWLAAWHRRASVIHAASTFPCASLALAHPSEDSDNGSRADRQRSSPISMVCLPDHWFMFQSRPHGFVFAFFLCNSSILLLQYFKLRLSPLLRDCSEEAYDVRHNLACAGEQIWLFCTGKDFVAQLGEVSRQSESHAWYQTVIGMARGLPRNQTCPQCHTTRLDYFIDSSN